MRIATEKDYTLTNGDSVRTVTNDLTHILDHLWSAGSDKTPLKLKVMFDLEVE